MAVNGSLHVLGQETSKALTGISGSGHILLTVAFVLLFVAIWNRIQAEPVRAAGAEDAVAASKVAELADAK